MNRLIGTLVHETQRLYHLASHLAVEGTPIEDWKLSMSSATVAIAP